MCIQYKHLDGSQKDVLLNTLNMIHTSLLRRHRLLIIGQNLLAGKKINSGDACQNKDFGPAM
jgi:hypothetical protein